MNVQIREELQQIAARLVEISNSLPAEPDEPTGDVVEVKEGEDLQKTIDAAPSGRTLMLSGTFKGNYHVRSGRKNWMTIQGGTIISPNNEPALWFHPGSSFVRLQDTAVTTTFDRRDTELSNLIRFDNDDPETTPHDFEFLGCYIAGSPTGNVRRGIALNAARVVIENCIFKDFHHTGEDAQAICGWSGPGSFWIRNNVIEASGENIMFGGGTPAYEGLVPSYITIEGNRIRKPWSWRQGHPDYAGIPWSVKNLLELKNARNVVIRGNLLENCWAHSQIGYAFLLTPRSEQGRAPWNTVQDVLIEKNCIRHCGGGFQMSSADVFGPTEQCRNITIRNNLLYDINTSYGGRGSFLDVSGYDGKPPILGVEISHNTFLMLGYGKQFVLLGDSGKVIEYLVFRDNIVEHGEYGFFGSGEGLGVRPMEKYCDGYEFDDNLIIGAPGNYRRLYPGGQAWEESIADVPFVDRHSEDFRVAENSDYVGAASDHGPLGITMDSWLR